ncbi:tetratricopeptide repeat protein [Thalassococcus sp. BH17M4-6]|uniref:tetratricopeptide repeat protein n=1 Tax=Thalassococcus sp. BH17M4-6 TaxID=3413148 RepID=UPI003BE12050
MRFAAVLLSCVLAAGPLAAQESETLADIRQDLSALYFEMQRLRTELSTTGGTGLTIGGGTLDRVNAIEAELQRLTSKTEEIEFRIGRVVEDGTNRIGDLEFRLCELEPGCDIALLGDTPRLGGGAAPAVPTGPAPVTETGDTGGMELAAGEESDFRRAQEALASGDFQSAADQFAAFRQTYPGGPLEAAALVGQGRALEGAGDMRSAARAYLDAYSGYPQADVAPEALFLLGRSLGALGSLQEACVTLAEVAVRYPGSPAISDAQAARTSLGCS